MRRSEAVRPRPGIAGEGSPEDRPAGGWDPLRAERPRAARPAPLPSPRPEVEVEVAEEEEERLDEPWRVILYNDEIHTFEEVIFQVIKATGRSLEEAEQLAWQVHLEGKGVAYEGSFEECFRVQAILREIQLVTEIEG